MRLAALLAIILALVSVPGIAFACGAFAGPPAPTDAELVSKLPYLTVEQVLLVWDKDTQMEDFVREARFAKSNQTFGFVVPTPTKPEVSGVKDAPFDRLRAKLPFEEIPSPAAGGGGKGGPPGSLAAAAPPPAVEVLARERIGSFTAFTLATTDAGAFDKWLKDNGFAMTAESRPWIAHYVRLKFFFVAFRYEPSDAGGDGMTSETVRIRFKTPNPYYPYMEPEHAANAPKPTSRMLTGWLVTKEPMVAVAAKPKSRPRFGRPWTFGIRKAATSAELAEILGPGLSAIVPPSQAALVVQPIRDVKLSRASYGDVVLVPEQPASFSQADIDARRFLLGVVDPVTIGEPDQEPTAAEDISFSEIPAPVPSVPPANKPSSSCSAAPGQGQRGPARLGWLALAAAVVGLVLRRRARGLPIARAGSRAGVVALVANALIGCQTPPPAPADAAVAPAPSSAAPVVAAAPPSPADRERIALDVLAGKIPAEGIAPNLPGDQGLRPRVQLAPSLVIEGGTLPTARKTLNAQLPRVRLCYQREVESSPNRQGELTVALTIAPDGSVANATTPENVAFTPGFINCVRRELQKAKFDGQGNQLTIRPTYQFSSE